MSAIAAQERATGDLSVQPGESRAIELAAPAHIAFVDGSASVDRDGVSQPAVANVPFEPGDRLRTVAGRVEVLFPDGTALDVDQNSAIDFLGPTLLRLTGGRALLVVAGVSNPAAALRFQIDTPAGSTRTDGPGEYRVAVSQSRDEAETELAVLRGSAVFDTDRGSIVIVAGQRAVARGGDTPQAEITNSAHYDDFDLWTLERRDARLVSTSAEYLPEDLRPYGATFDQDGSWEYMQPYGYVWYPAVTSDWKPYYHGYWRPHHRWGWTWIGSDRWTWPTHHYGRWGTSANRWFWIPGNSWAPAWVSWASAPGYVSWCPLGFDGRPAVAFSNDTHRWSAWTAMPRRTFTTSARVDRSAAAPQTVPAATAFAVQRSAPVAPVARAPHREVPAATGGVAVPRIGNPESRVAGAELAPADRPDQNRPSKVDSREPRFETPALPVRRAPAAVPRAYERPPATTTPAAPAVAVPRPLPAAPAAAAPAVSASAPHTSTPAAPAAVPRSAAPAQAVPRTGTTPAPPTAPASAAPARPAPAQSSAPGRSSGGAAARKQ